MDSSEARLTRIESKLDKLAEAMTMIARVEEKIVANQARVDRIEVRLDEQEGEVDTLKTVVAQNASHVRTAERLAWIIISSVIGLATYYLR